MKQSLLLLGLVWASVSTGQTKSETIKWLNEKFLKHTVSTHSKNTGTNEIRTVDLYSKMSAKIKDSLLIIEYDWSYISKVTSSGKSSSFPTQHIKYLIKVSELRELKANAQNSELHFTTFDNSIRKFVDGKEEKYHDSNVFISFACEGEADLVDRVGKALIHLKAFYPREKKNETF